MFNRKVDRLEHPGGDREIVKRKLVEVHGAMGADRRRQRLEGALMLGRGTREVISMWSPRLISATGVLISAASKPVVSMNTTCR